MRDPLASILNHGHPWLGWCKGYPHDLGNLHIWLKYHLSLTWKVRLYWDSHPNSHHHSSRTVRSWWNLPRFMDVSPYISDHSWEYHGNIMDCLMGIIVPMGFPMSDCPIFYLALSPLQSWALALQSPRLCPFAPCQREVGTRRIYDWAELPGWLVHLLRHKHQL